ncbi:MAG: undecaprenyl-diphosphate phosphatase [Planctomycetota bacterium]|nr:undecaprenyl-diphosphate phosphatase [Planctomycetota bacterium]
MDSAYGGIGYFWAAILGLVQGLAEFLPVSSSGHLALVERLGMGVPAPAAFDVFLHLATIAVVIVYFRSAIRWYIRNDPLALGYVVAASVPTGLVGILFKDSLEALRLSPNMICLGLLVTAALLFATEILRGAGYQIRDLGWFGAVTVGFCQALAIVPGISRSGATIAGAVLCGVDRKEAFGFSFILSIPAVLGAALLHVREMLHSGEAETVFDWASIGPLLLGCAVAAAAGYAALRILERVVIAGRLAWFAAYCCLVAVAGLVYFNFFN